MENQYCYEGWRSFHEGSWVHEIDLRSFIRHNFTMYDGNESFLEGPTQDTLDLWEQVMDLTRHVLVPGITDDPKQLVRLGAAIAALPNITALDVLPYHVMGIPKYLELRIPYPLAGVEAATYEQAKHARKIILAAYHQVRSKQAQA